MATATVPVWRLYTKAREGRTALLSTSRYTLIPWSISHTKRPSCLQQARRFRGDDFWARNRGATWVQMSYAVSPSMSDDERDIDIESDVSGFLLFFITVWAFSHPYVCSLFCNHRRMNREDIPEAQVATLSRLYHNSFSYMERSTKCC